jgi:hypothetical protein
MATFWPDGLCRAELAMVSGAMTGGIQDSHNSPDDTVGALAYHILDIILFRHIEGDLPGATAPSWGARHWRNMERSRLRECAEGKDELSNFWMVEAISKAGRGVTGLGRRFRCESSGECRRSKAIVG